MTLIHSHTLAHPFHAYSLTLSHALLVVLLLTGNVASDSGLNCRMVRPSPFVAECDNCTSQSVCINQFPAKKKILVNFFAITGMTHLRVN
jgi:hypothetical protein